ncbi:uncharacterized protein PITG_00813 [Phytophthora infestans T30-4]|uniref:Uncharacterized protein n=1 Tax=Phytophthora infestans (strain T30-4) TaxID=403677 RepID=D0MRR7_PHYIT|nr:uncharacterized protein PITG_00813 [Phytophthora infestans T30-4]EEY58186.1 hypothetical protein PITG_00813 [Phytophthora infestans T30-4]|eukprot:XP_002909372.1 hypothetical protein PITG_00813 [Phytophthora infestans T30-4]
MPVQARNAATSLSETPTRSSPDSCTPSWGLSGHPWKTPTCCRIAAVGPESHSSWNGTLPKAFLKSYHTSKLCSPQPFTALNPFCPGACLSFTSSQRTSRRASTPV